MDLAQIQSLIKFVSKSGASEVELETKDFKIVIKTPSADSRRKSSEAEQAMIQAQMPMAAPVQAMPHMQHMAPPAPVAAPPATETKPAAEDSEDSKYITFKSPMIGTFYRSSSPETDSFVNVGDSIAPGKVVCIIEAMKLFNEIEAEHTGKIVKVLVDDASPVEYDQPLFLIDPS